MALHNVHLHSGEKPQTKLIFDLAEKNGKDKFENRDFVPLPNGKLITLRNNQVSLYENQQQEPILVKDFATEDDGSYGYTMVVSENRVFLTSNHDTREIDPNTLEVLRVYDYAGEPPIYLSSTQMTYIGSYGPNAGTAYISSIDDCHKNQIALNDKYAWRAISIKKMTSHDLIVVRVEEIDSDKKNDNPKDTKAFIDIWRETKEKWEKIQSISFNLPPNFSHYKCNVLYPTHNQMLIFCYTDQEITIIPILLDDFSIQQSWTLPIGCDKDSWFKHLHQPLSAWDSTFDARTIIFYKHAYLRPVLKLYYLDLSTRALRLLNLNTDNPNEITDTIHAVSANQIYLGGTLKEGPLQLEDLNFTINSLRIPCTATHMTALTSILSTTGILRDLGVIAKDYSANDFPLDYPANDIKQNTDEMRSIQDEDAKESLLKKDLEDKRNAYFKSMRDEIKRLKQEIKKRELEHKQDELKIKKLLEIKQRLESKDSLDKTEPLKLLLDPALGIQNDADEKSPSNQVKKTVAITITTR